MTKGDDMLNNDSAISLQRASFKCMRLHSSFISLLFLTDTYVFIKNRAQALFSHAYF